MTVEQTLPWVLLLSILAFAAWWIFRPSTRSRKTDFRVITASAVMLVMTGGFIFWQSGFRPRDASVAPQIRANCHALSSPMPIANCLASEQEGMSFYLFGTNSEVQPAFADFENPNILEGASINHLTPQGFDKADPSAPFFFVHHNENEIAALREAIDTDDYGRAWTENGWLKWLGDFADEWTNPREYSDAVMESYFCGVTPDGQPCSEGGVANPSSGRCPIMPPGSFSCPEPNCEAPKNCNGGELDEATNTCASTPPPGGGGVGSLIGGPDVSSNDAQPGDGENSPPAQQAGETMAIMFFNHAPAELVPEMLGLLYVDSTDWVQSWSAGIRGVRGLCVSDRNSTGVLKGVVLTEGDPNPCEEQGENFDFVPMSVAMAGVSKSLPYRLGRGVGVGVRLGGRLVPAVGAAVTTFRVAVTGIRLAARYSMQSISRGIRWTCAPQRVLLRTIAITVGVWTASEFGSALFWKGLEGVGWVTPSLPSEGSGRCFDAINKCWEDHPIPKPSFETPMAQVRLGGQLSKPDEQFLDSLRCMDLKRCIEGACGIPEANVCPQAPCDVGDLCQPGPTREIRPDAILCDANLTKASLFCKMTFPLPPSGSPIKELKSTASCINYSEEFNDQPNFKCAFLQGCKEGPGLVEAKEAVCDQSPETAAFFAGTIVDPIQSMILNDKLWRGRPSNSP